MMIPTHQLAQASCDFLCPTLVDASPHDVRIPKNHVLRLCQDHIRACSLCKEAIDEKSVVTDINLIKRVVNLSIGKALASSTQENENTTINIAIDSSPLSGLSKEDLSRISTVAQHIIEAFASSYR